MTSFAKILTGAATVALVATSAPAAAQYAPYGNPNTSVGSVIQQVLGGGRYGAYGQGNDRIAVDQCARAAEARVSRDYRNSGYGNRGYNDPRYGNQAYGYNQASTARVVAITQVERRSNGLRVSGAIDSGMGYRGAYGNQGYGYGTPGYGNQGYNPGYANQGYPNQYGNVAPVADLRFTCRVDFRGYVTSLDIKRNVAARRGY